MTEGARRRRILVATFGSAGDLFPVMPAILHLARDGHDVRLATGRATGLYGRALGLTTLALGDGSDLRVVDDAATFTTRRGGWASWRRVVQDYVAPCLAADVARLTGVFDTWRPDVIVATTFAAAARLAGRTMGIPVLTVSIYPQIERLASAPSPYATAYVRQVEALGGGEADGPGWAAWGAPADVMVHDRALLGDHNPALDPIGFPQFDEVPGSAEDIATVDQRAADGDTTVLVTLGSFIGMAQRKAWSDAAAAVAALGVSAVFVGARGRWADEAFGHRRDIAAVGYVPLGRHLPAFDAVVHHGGIGTTFTALRAGRPAVAVPQAFDQPWNAALVAERAVGVDGSRMDLAGAMRQVLGGPVADRATDVASTMIGAERATDVLVARVLEAGGG